ncbi:hypothetical protein F7734_36905 [Scytonema sp. UIC 10036]|uniref:hypothetical protein n=1 Tax=Scytonema sp. UIC 10036 TaxID=2304196 RepID=UPI0012DA605A|nr:hypothetical protein [Scytonema sp. UIC 10036]MUG97603.1 hypothetical protein [Scytonema sp. UIC 10036]
MEDYQSAFMHRHIDTETLHRSGRKIATMHFGGITIECLLKSMIFATLPKGASQEWKTESNNPGHTITNPGHSYTEALNRHNRLRSRLDKFPEVRKWLDEVENPSQHFIDMRYCCNEPDDENYKRWLDKYQRLIKWLQKQATSL